MELTVSRYVETAPSSNGRDTLVFSTRSGHLTLIDSVTWKKLVAGNSSAVDRADRDILLSAEILVPAGEDEFQKMITASQSAINSSRILSRTVMVSAYCQLGCQYCGQTHSNLTLNRSLADKLVGDIEHHLSTSNYTGFRVTWFGGEPTTAPTVLSDLSERLIQLCERRDVSYDAQIITNGFGLSAELANRLVLRCQVSHFIISIDGVDEVHDRRRPTKKGNGTFHTILQNVVRLSRDESLSHAKLTVRVNVGPDNAPRVHELIELLADLGLADRVNVQFARVIHWNQAAINDTVQGSVLATMEVGWFAHLASRGFKPGLLPKPRPSACLASEPSSQVIAADGTIHNCTMTPLAEHAITQSTALLGHLDRSEVVDGSNAQASILALLQSESLPCRQCTMLFLCQGGCPKDLESGLLPCPTFKHNLKSRLALHEATQALHSAQRINFDRVEFRVSLQSGLQDLIKRALLDHALLFRRRFRPFRIPSDVVVSNGDTSTSGVITAHAWQHSLLPGGHYETPSSSIISELARLYLCQLNPRLFGGRSYDGVSAAIEIATGFADWATTRIAPAASESVPSETTRWFASLASRYGIDQFLAQPAATVLRVWERLRVETPNDAPMTRRPIWIPLHPVH